MSDEQARKIIELLERLITTTAKLHSDLRRYNGEPDRR